MSVQFAKPAVGFVLGAILTVLLSGCGDAERQKAERFIQKQLEAQRDLVKVLQSIRDRDSMEASWPKIVKLNSRMRESQQWGAIIKPSRIVQEQLARSYGKKIQQLRRDQAKEMKRIEELPIGEEFIEKLNSLRTSQATIIQGTTP